MYELQILIQRRRKLIARLMIVTILGLAATLAVLPRADAHVRTAGASEVSLLSPQPVWGTGFSRLYPPAPEH